MYLYNGIFQSWSLLCGRPLGYHSFVKSCLSCSRAFPRLHLLVLIPRAPSASPKSNIRKPCSDTISKAHNQTSYPNPIVRRDAMTSNIPIVPHRNLPNRSQSQRHRGRTIIFLGDISSKSQIANDHDLPCTSATTRSESRTHPCWRVL